ncbi:flagellin N-terminal helical domain-containing protein [Salibacterium qingdaonense]|uniref:Flagellin n=1 Tax=Salibacterium qingdaonense TaxID=266892 RepID=A0A1I4R4B0_9BACI|nr:flagellin [Salibacterium qingdaonense]SFM46975.1 flagellin [Salibacterium qingdaonense]
MIINSNIPALNTLNQLNKNNKALTSSMEKLSSGQRINKAADDAAGLAISEKMEAQIRGLDQASRNSQDGISLIQTAEGALDETHSILQRMRELSVQSANGTNTDKDRESLQKEFGELTKEIDGIAKNTQFNKKNLLDGSFKESIQVGANADQNFDIDINRMDSTKLLSKEKPTLGITNVEATDNFDDGDYTISISKNEDDDPYLHLTGGEFDLGRTVSSSESHIDWNRVAGETQTLLANFNYEDLKEGELNLSVNNGEVTVDNKENTFITDQEEAENTISIIDDAIETVSSERSKLGAYQNRLEHTISNLNNSSENLSSAESRVRDVDMAQEMMEQTRASTLAQASQSMLAQANQQPQQVLQLLQ